jgi:hypothetical protein
MWWVLSKESKMGKEEGEAERRVKGKERKEAKRLWIKCLGGGTPVAAAEVFLWYKTGSETGDKRQQNGGDWFGMKEEGKQQQQETACVSCPLNRKASWCQTVAKSNPAVDSCDLPPSHAATNRNLPVFAHCSAVFWPGGLALRGLVIIRPSWLPGALPCFA